MIKTLICPICGKAFVTLSPNGKYCGQACAEVGRRQLRAKWKEDNPEYSAVYMRQYRTAKKERKKTTL